MTYILHIETATKVCSVALSKNGELVQLKELQEEGYSHGENLTFFIQEVLSKQGIQMRELAAVSLASGPGSYTGLRIGAATAKGLCYSLKIPLIAIDALTALTEIAIEKKHSGNMIALIDARRMEVYSIVRNDQGIVLKEISADVVDETTYKAFEPFTYFGDGSTKLEQIWADRNCFRDHTILSSAKGQVQIAYRKFLANQFEDTAYWEPFYLKDFIVGKKKS